MVNKESPWLEIFTYQYRLWHQMHTMQAISCLSILIMQFTFMLKELDGAPDEDLELTCSADSLEWETRGFVGDLFLLFHTFVMISASLQVERTFY